MHLRTSLLAVLSFTLCITACKKWDDHIAVTNPDLTTNLSQAISQRTDLSKFYEYLQKTGLDKELETSKSYTVWAPTNDALQTLDQAIIADTAQLKLFLRNHIALQTYFTRNAQSPVRVLMLNGKRVTFSNNTFAEATVTEADKYLANGVLHVINKTAPALPNAWEFVNNTRTTYAQNNFVALLSTNVFDAASAVIDSFNSVTGQPIYRPGTGIVQRNAFNQEVFDLKSEEKEYTYFVLNNAALTTEINKLTGYFKTSSPDTTLTLAAFATVRDLAVEGYYTKEQLPDTLVSKFGVKIPINKNRIVETRRLSNGVAYIMSEVNFVAKSKIPTIIIQGEGPRVYFNPATSTTSSISPTQNNVSAAIIRSKISPVTGQPFNDIFIYGHGIANLSVRYQAVLSSVKYKVYWVAVNDTITLNGRINPVAFNQRLAMGTINANFLPATPAAGISVTPLNYNEVFVGDYTPAAYGLLNMYLTGNNSTANGTNSLTLDYIKLVPDIQ